MSQSRVGIEYSSSFPTLNDYILLGPSKIPVPIKLHPTTGIESIVLQNGELPDAEFAKWPIAHGKELRVRALGTKTIDGIKFENNKIVTPLRLDIDYLTGFTLRDDAPLKFDGGELKEFKTLFSNFKKQNPAIGWSNDDTDFLKIPENLAELQKFANHTNSEVSYIRIEKASSRIEIIKNIINSKVEKIFEGRTPVTNPGYTAAMGGTGAGKDSLIDMAKKDFGDNFVVASLDDARTLFQGYFDGVGGGLDYPHLKLAASIVRQSIINKALNEKYNVFKDGTGVPAKDTKEAIELAKSKGFKTRIYATTCPIYHEQDKPLGYNEQVTLGTNFFVGALQRSADRYKTSGRWVPSDIILKKHQQVSEEAPNLYFVPDQFILIDNSGPKDTESIILETFVISDNKVKELKTNPKILIDESGQNQDTGGQTKIATIVNPQAYEQFIRKGTFNIKTNNLFAFAPLPRKVVNIPTTPVPTTPTTHVTDKWQKNCIAEKNKGLNIEDYLQQRRSSWLNSRAKSFIH